MIFLHLEYYERITRINRTPTNILAGDEIWILRPGTGWVGWGSAGFRMRYSGTRLHQNFGQRHTVHDGLITAAHLAFGLRDGDFVIDRFSNAIGLVYHISNPVSHSHDAAFIETGVYIPNLVTHLPVINPFHDSIVNPMVSAQYGVNTPGTPVQARGAGTVDNNWDPIIRSGEIRGVWAGVIDGWHIIAIRASYRGTGGDSGGIVFCSITSSVHGMHVGGWSNGDSIFVTADRITGVFGGNLF